MGVYDYVILDGQNMFHKAFATQRELSVTIDGHTIGTGGPYGFFKSMITIKNNYLNEDGKLAIAWDRGHARRTKLYPAYKANRGDKNEWADYNEFKGQLMMLQEMLKLAGVSQLYKEGEEADDLVATYSVMKAAEGNKVLIVSADKDYQQMIGKNVDLLAHKGKDNIKLWNRINWTQEHGYQPQDFVFVLALAGDPGDNIPGVQGIGVKGAEKLIMENYDMLCNIIDQSPWEMPKKVSAAHRKLEASIEDFRLSYKLALADSCVKGFRLTKTQKKMDLLEQVFETYKYNDLLKKGNWQVLEGL